MEHAWSVWIDENKKSYPQKKSATVNRYGLKIKRSALNRSISWSQKGTK